MSEYLKSADKKDSENNKTIKNDLHNPFKYFVFNVLTFVFISCYFNIIVNCGGF